MPVLVRLPQALAVDAAGETELPIELGAGGTLGDLMSALRAQYPALARRLCDETGELRRFVNAYVGSDESRALQGMATPIPEGTVILVAGSVAGG